MKGNQIFLQVFLRSSFFHYFICSNDKLKKYFDPPVYLRSILCQNPPQLFQSLDGSGR
jgi:hypothetical protein